jgi:general secretion pathway protein D
MQRARRLVPAVTSALALLATAVALVVTTWAVRGSARAAETLDSHSLPAVEASPLPPGPHIVEADGERYITMDFQDVDLAILVKFIGEITGKNFVMDERVQGKVTVVSPTKITAEEAYQVFQAVLQVKGFTTIPSGAAVRIIPTKDAKETSLRVLTQPGGQLPSEEYVTRLVPLSQVDAADIATILQPLVSKDGLISAYPQTNSLIIIDSAANLDRLTRMIAELDVASSRRRTAIIPLKHAAASEIAETVQQVLEERPSPPGQPPPGQRPLPPGQIRAFKITPDDRTNTLIVNAAAEQMAQIKSLVERLDVPLPPGSGRINVYYLKNANAEDLLPVLLDVIGAAGGGRTTRTQRQGQAAGGRQRRQRGSSLRRSYSDRRRRGAQPAQQGGQTGQQAIEFVSDVRITADPATNALIITAAPEDYDLLLGVIEKLDIRRRQVYVEAIILEVTIDRMRQLGIETQGGVALSDGVGIGRVSLGNLNQALTQPGTLSGLVLAAVSNQTVTLPDGTKVPAQAALLTALQNDTDINILSAPNILTTDNEEAEIIVGQNVPFVASRATSETNLSNTFATVDREDVGITLRLTPQISEGAVVRMALFEEVSAIVPNPILDANEVGPTTTVRSASTTITVKDGQTVVIGGLISDAITARESKVPFISDVPVVGNFFRRTDSEKSKINLLIFLTPHIIKDERDAATVSVAERDRFRTTMKRSGSPKRVPDPLDMPSFELRGDLVDEPPEPPAAEVMPSGRGQPAAPEQAQERARLGPDEAATSTRAEGGGSLALAGITIDRQTNGAVIRLDVGATPTRVTHYALENRGRYVIDVYGLSEQASTVDVVPVIDPLVRRARVAHHHGRMRIVLDLATARPPAYVLERRGATIALKLGATRASDKGAPGT